MFPTAADPVLLIAIEMSNTTWKLAFGYGPKRRMRDVPARDLAALDEELAATRVKLEVTPDARTVSCYEAGRDGFWLHRALLSRGLENVVVDPASIEVDRRAKKRKTDRLDAKKLLKLLCWHVFGADRVWSVVHVPSAEDEDARHDSRERDRLLKERTQHSNCIKALLIQHGLDVKVDKHLDLDSLRLWDGSRLPPGLKARAASQYKRWQLVIERLSELERARQKILKENRQAEDPEQHNARLAKVNRLTELRGIGAEGAYKLTHEFFWRRFNNRREVGAAAGLTGTPFASGNTDNEQGISKAGNRAVRGLIVELGWLWLRFQPNSQLTLWFNEKFASGTKRMRRVGIVALSRRLLIALWRYVEHGVVPAGASLKAAP